MFLITNIFNKKLFIDVYSLKSVQQQYTYPVSQNVVNVNKKLEKQKENSPSTPCCNL